MPGGLLELLRWILPYAILALLPGMVLYALVRTAMTEARQRRRLERFAAEHGFEFEPRPAAEIHERFEVSPKLDRLEPFASGFYRSSRNAVRGTRGGIHWQIFDYHCRFNVSEGHKTMEYYTIVSASVGVPFPRTTLRPRNIVYRLMSLVGFEDLPTGDERFDRRFLIRGEDPTFARALLQPEMKRFLQDAQHRFWQLGSHGIVLFLKGHAPARRITATMRELEAFVGCIPKPLLSAGHRPERHSSPHFGG
jgi:hypothetical protein